MSILLTPPPNEAIQMAADLLSRCGDEAKMIAVHRVGTLVGKGDQQAFMKWMHVLRAIDQIRRNEVEPGARQR